MQATKKAGDYRSLKETLAKMTWKQRIEHIWSYYKWGILIAAMIIFVLVGVVSSMLAGQVETLFSGYLVNMYPTEDGQQYLTVQYRDSLGGAAGEQTVLLTAATGISMEEMAASTVGVDTGVQVSAMMGAGSLDYIIMDQEGLDYFIGQNAFLPVTEVLTHDQLEDRQSALVYHENESGKSLPLALEITDLPFAINALQHEGPIYIAFPASSARTSTASGFFDYLLEWDGSV